VLSNPVIIKRPVSVWNKDLSFSPKVIFTSLAKAFISGAVSDGKGVAENIVALVDGISIDEKPAYAAWLLIHNSLTLTLSQLLSESKETNNKIISDDEIERFSTILEKELNDIQVSIDCNFFECPQKLPLLTEIKEPIKKWLMSLGLSEASAEALYCRIAGRFSFVLSKEWRTAPDDYKCILTELDSPFKDCIEKEQNWIQYNSWLQEQPNASLFDEVFSLKQVYVPLRAYYEESIPQRTHSNPKNSKATKKTVISLDEDIQSWVRKFDLSDPIRIICGGPGSGKSSFAKVLAAYVSANIPDVRVIFIPINHFNFNHDLTSSLENFVKKEKYLIGSPLDVTTGEERLLIIFDGLDELAMQGKAALEMASQFINDVRKEIQHSNHQGCQRQVLITGRNVVIQSASTQQGNEREVINLLPYYIPEGEIPKFNFIDNQNLLKTDQRDLWWSKYLKAKGQPCHKLPSELSTKELTPITSEPLLNYLVALSYERNEIDFSKKLSLNNIYYDLLCAVYERQWDFNKHNTTSDMRQHEFILLLEEIGLAAWHGDGRTATVHQIVMNCSRVNLDNCFYTFQENSKNNGASRLLVAFYFQEISSPDKTDNTYEFTHKSFGEYLVARRIVNAVIDIIDKLVLHDKDSTVGITEKDALIQLCKFFGPTPIDQYILDFLINEVALRTTKVDMLQTNIARLIAFTGAKGMPMESLDIDKFNDMRTQSNNTEETLMAFHYACAIVTKNTIKVDWQSITNFGDWVKRIQGQRVEGKTRIIDKCLAWLDISNSQLAVSDFSHGNMENTNFSKSILTVSTFFNSELSGADFTLSQLNRVDFENTNLDNLDFVRARLYRANFSKVILTNVNFTRARLEETNLASTMISTANFDDARLLETNFRGAIIKDTSFDNTEIDRADFMFAQLRNMDFSSSILTEVKFCEADLKGAKFNGANLSSSDLRNANLEMADFQGAYLAGAKFEGARLDGANFYQSIFEGSQLPKGVTQEMLKTKIECK